MLSVLLNKKIFPLALSSLISKVGDFAHDVVFALIAIEMLDGNHLYIGLMYFLRYIPYFFTGPIGGWLSERFAYKKNMMASDIFRFFVSVYLYLAYVLNAIDIFSLTVCGMLLTIGRSFYQPSFRSYLPEIARGKDLADGNSIFQIIEDAASIIGPLICSVLIVNFDKSSVLLFDSFTYVVSVIMLFFVATNKRRVSISFSMPKLLYETKESVIKMKEANHNLFMVIIVTSVCVLFTAALLKYIFPAAIVDKFGREEYVGYIFSLMSIGTVTGSILYPKVIKETTSLLVMHAWCVYGILFFTVAIVINANLLILLFFVFLLGFSGAIVDISIITNIQESSNGSVGRNYGIYSSLANACEAFSGVVSAVFYFFLGGFTFPVMAILIGVTVKLLFLGSKDKLGNKNEL